MFCWPCVNEANIGVSSGLKFCLSIFPLWVTLIVLCCRSRNTGVATSTAPALRPEWPSCRRPRHASWPRGKALESAPSHATTVHLKDSDVCLRNAYNKQKSQRLVLFVIPESIIDEVNAVHRRWFSIPGFLLLLFPFCQTQQWVYCMGCISCIILLGLLPEIHSCLSSVWNL